MRNFSFMIFRVTDPTKRLNELAKDVPFIFEVLVDYILISSDRFLFVEYHRCKKFHEIMTDFIGRLGTIFHKLFNYLGGLLVK
jgi:hypothetical protein